MREKGSLEWDIVLGHVAGYRRQDRPWMCWIDSIKEAAGLCLDSLKKNSKRKKMEHAGGRKDSK
jgi:protein-disulfide isomerase